MSDEAMPQDAMPGEALSAEAVHQEGSFAESMFDNGTRSAVGTASEAGSRIGAGAVPDPCTRSGAGSLVDSGTCTGSGAPSATADPPSEFSPMRASDRALFRAHAAARLRGDTPEALRLALQIGEEKRMAHLLYVLYLFTWTVYEELGDTPDPWDLADLTRRLHERHHRPGGGFWAIRSEAMVRGVCGDSALLTEVPVAAQSTYMWAVIDELVGAEITDAWIGEALDQAEAIGAELVRTGWNSMFAEVPAPRPAAAPEPSAATVQEPESVPTAAATAPVGPDSEDDSTDSGDRTGDVTGDQLQDRKADGLGDQGRDRQGDATGDQGRDRRSVGAGDRPRDRESGGPADQASARTDIEADQEANA